MIKKQFFLCIILLTILLSGCSKKPQDAPKQPFIGGTSALQFEFIESSPPLEVYDRGTYPFEVTLNIENKGEYDVPKNKLIVTLAGFYPPDFNNPNITKRPDDDLTKSYIDSKGNIVPGAITYLTFPGFNFKNSLAAEKSSIIRANLCYVYGTIARSDICVLKDLAAEEGRVCRVIEKKPVQSSSAPVQIENFEESIAGSDKIAFSFDVVQRGSGLISQKESRCNDENTYKNRVWVEVDSGLLGLKCSGIGDGAEAKGFTALYSGKRRIICTQDLISPQIRGKDFIKEVRINAVYDYKEHKEVNVLVKHAVNPT